MVASAARDFGAENPRAPLRLRAGVDTEDGVVVAGGDVGSDGARRREMVRDVIVRSKRIAGNRSLTLPIVLRSKKYAIHRHYLAAFHRKQWRLTAAKRPHIVVPTLSGIPT